MRCKCIHAILALLFQITLAGTKPDEGSLAVGVLQIGVYIFDKDDRFACSSWSFDGNYLLCTGGSCLVVEEIDAVFLKFVIFDAVYHISPASLSSKSK